MLPLTWHFTWCTLPYSSFKILIRVTKRGSFQKLQILNWSLRQALFELLFLLAFLTAPLGSHLLGRCHSWCVHAQLLQLCLTLCSPMGPLDSPVHGIIPARKYWSGLACSPPGNLPVPGIEPGSPGTPASPARIFTTWVIWKVPWCK